MKRPKILRHALGLALLLSGAACVFAHQISLIRAGGVVHRDKVELQVAVMPEDILLSAGGYNIVTGRVAKADVLRGVEVHPKYLLDGLIILDEDGHRLTGKVTKFDLPPLPEDWVPLDDLM